MNAVQRLTPQPFEANHPSPRRVSRFAPGDPAQVHYRRLLSALDEDELLNLESDIEYFLSGGPMSPALSGVLCTTEAAA